ncbi:MAG: hypothetical protein ACLUD1_08485 [Clostridia bacterium]
MESDGKINVNALIRATLRKENKSGQQDGYKIEEDKLWYYDKEANQTNLGEVAKLQLN